MLGSVSEGSRTTVVLADDHPVYREGLRRAVAERPDLELLGEAENGRDAVTQIRTLAPKVGVLDLRMPGLSGEDLIATVVREAPNTKVLVLSAFDEAEIVFSAISAGASGYLAKDASRTAICEVALDPQLQSGLLGQIRARADPVAPALTPREHEVLTHVAEGLTSAQIGERLFLSPATVKSHLSTIYDKLGVPDRSSAVAVAIRRGLLD
jgi:two-component system, NarL family, nitrate/nitrite response regulator NarL